MAEPDPGRHDAAIRQKEHGIDSLWGNMNQRTPGPLRNHSSGKRLTSYRTQSKMTRQNLTKQVWLGALTLVAVKLRGTRGWLFQELWFFFAKVPGHLCSFVPP